MKTDEDAEKKRIEELMDEFITELKRLGEKDPMCLLPKWTIHKLAALQIRTDYLWQIHRDKLKEDQNDHR